MSYKNPQQVVDTQSGQHIRNLQKTIAGTAVDVIDTFSKEEKARKVKEEADNKEWDRLQKIQSDNEINAGNIYNKSAQSNFFSLESTGVALNGQAGRFAELKAKTNLSPQEKVEFTNLTGLSGTLKDGMTTIGSQVATIKLDIANRGSQGGAARGQDIRGGKFAMGMSNEIPGKKWFDVDNSKEGGSQITYYFQEEGSDDVISYTSQQLKDLENSSGASMYHKIPNQTKQIKTLVDEGNIWGVQDGSKVQSPREEYYKDGETYTKTVDGEIITYQKINKEKVLESLFLGAQGNVQGMSPNDQVSFNNYLNEQLDIDKKNNLAYGGKLEEKQVKELATKYARYASREKIGDSEIEISRVPAPKEKETEVSGNTYMNSHKKQLATMNNWSVDKKSKTQSVRLQDNSKGNEDTKALPYYIKFDPKTNQTYIHTEKGAVDDRTSGAKVTKKEAFDRFGLTIEDSFEEQDASSSKNKDAKSEKWEDDNPVSSVESTENRAKRKAKDLKQTSKTSGSDWNKIPGVKK
jgi:hypothetical protein